MTENIRLQALPPKEAIEYFRAKGYKTTFDWRDMWQQEHAYAFTVAKVMRNDILQDIRQAVDTALANGTTFEEFRTTLRPTLQAKGWWGIQQMTDPKTGLIKDVQLGSSRRLKTIFDVNMRTAYAVGRWEQVQRTKKNRPFLRYIGIDDGRQREEHRHWNDIILPVDHPFWNEHYPPNGWKCRCSVQQLSERDLEKRGLAVNDKPPSDIDKVWIDKRNGLSVRVPKGIDPGFAYNVGKSRMQALSPPALDKPLAVPFSGSLNLAPPPAPQKLPANMLLDDGLEEEEYARKFLAEFGADIGKPVVFKDVIDEPLIISDELFKTASGKLKIKRRERHRYLLHLASTIKDPDEIYWMWEEYPKGRMTLTRRYIKKWEVPQGKTTAGFAIFDVSEAGWSGITTFPPESDNYLNKQRAGTLAYRRPDNPKKGS